MFIATVLLSLVLAAVFAALGSFMIVRNPSGADMADRLGFSVGAFRIIGWLEVLFAVGLLVGLFYPLVGEVSAIALAVLMLGAVLNQVRLRDAFAKLAPPLTLGALAVVAFLLRAQTV